ncbi:phosphoserine phosphatase SerB [Novosphingobium sp. Gsoil 351]|uniref:phosphoserine phosphatase SerB n=1 Tax=Novosphingobium sp. Gsoil 351 TaxID=2675225 RepID=UPI0012B45427|nr:phosphoserine phosphatase SerB [Novosphingobium sp. Gsoil 351]QGN56228.1 phosphoserine phosphatase SerB [Novosphingobium sp. Gsoil 351]
MLIARLLAETATLAGKLDAARSELLDHGWPVAMAETVISGEDAIELLLPEGEAGVVRSILGRHFAPCDLLVTDRPIAAPQLFVSDMDSTMIGQECIDELADYAGIKPQIAAITERAMQGELDFRSALRERVALLAGLDEGAIARCLAERIRPMPGAKTLVATLKGLGCDTVLVTGGFHAFADPVAEELGFDRVVGNRLAVASGKLTGYLDGPVSDSATKARTLAVEAERLGAGTVSLAMGDGANDVPMLQAATFGIAYHAKPKAREAADGWIERGDLTAVLELLGIAKEDWTRG